MIRAVSNSSAPVVFAINGASGMPYEVRLLEMLATNHVPTWLLGSAHGWRLLAEECGIKDEAALKQATGDDWGDRKSTRLNSSHGYISYAVFCLKKKKKKRNEI